MICIRTGVLVLLLLLPIGRGGFLHAAPSDKISTMVDELLANNLELSSLQARVRALELEAPYAGSLADPRVTLAIANLPVDSFSFDQENMTQKQIGVAQAVPWFGILSLREKGAELVARQAAEQMQIRKLSLIREVKVLRASLALSAEKKHSNKVVIEYFHQIISNLEYLHSVDAVGQEKVLDAQVKLSLLENKQIKLALDQQVVEDSLGALLHREQLFQEKISPYVFGEQLAVDRESLLEQVFLYNPLILERKIALQIAKNNLALAEKSYMPQMDFRVAYGQRNDDPMERADLLTAGVTFTVPLWKSSRQDSLYAGRKNKVRSANFAVQSLEKRIPHQLDSYLVAIRQLKKSIELYDKALTKQQKQLVQTSQSSYSLGTLALQEVLEAHVKEEEMRLAMRTLQYSLYQKECELEEFLGKGPTAQLEVEDA